MIWEVEEVTYVWALTLSLSLRSDRISLALIGTPIIDKIWIKNLRSAAETTVF